MARSFLDVLANHYPERLGYAVCMNAPVLWWAFFSVVRPFLDPVTAAKIRFIDQHQTTALAVSCARPLRRRARET